MKISELKGEQALDVLADILEPVVEILQDKEIMDEARDGATNLGLVQKILKLHKKEVLQIMAIVDQEDPETYAPNIFVLPSRLLELFSMPEMKVLFTSQGQKNGGEHSGSAMENTEGKGK